jgi:hypothetical protein
MALRAFGAVAVGGRRRNPIDVSDDSVELDPPANICLSGDSARKFFGHDVGEPVSGTIKGRVTSKAINTYLEPNEGDLSVGIEITNFQERPPDSLSEVTELMALLADVSPG